jgi:hypothetical protein
LESAGFGFAVPRLLGLGFLVEDRDGFVRLRGGQQLKVPADR